jgi:hypothetical protein
LFLVGGRLFPFGDRLSIFSDRLSLFRWPFISFDDQTDLLINVF